MVTVFAHWVIPEEPSYFTKSGKVGPAVPRKASLLRAPWAEIPLPKSIAALPILPPTYTLPAESSAKAPDAPVRIHWAIPEALYFTSTELEAAARMPLPKS